MNRRALLLSLPAAACRSARIQSDIRYGPHPDNLLDLWHPRTAPSVASIVVHGGAWTSGSRSGMAGLCRWFAAHGFVVANVEYRKTRAPDAILDVRAAARWVHGNTGCRIVLCGTSSGAHLALMAALPTGDAGFGPAPDPAAVVDLWGPTDLTLLLELARDWLPETGAARRFSPIEYVSPSAPPVLAVHVTGDPVVPFDQSRRLVDALRRAGARAELRALPGLKHAPGLDEVFPLVKTFLRSTVVGWPPA
jgi:acetyl esterase/lipase